MKIHFPKTVWSDMIILEEHSRFALVDTGMDDQYGQLKEYLDRLGVCEIEFILLTHFHRDHYGNIGNLLRDYEVKKVYFKEYGGHDTITAWGSEADEAYRQSEKDKWSCMKALIEEKSRLEMVETIDSLFFEGTLLYLYANDNKVQKMWEDKTYPEIYHKEVFYENQNSLAVYFEYRGKTVFLGGDVMDCDFSHPLASYVNLQIAEQINKQIYLYKAPHHGTDHTACEKTLAIYKPQVAVITNGMEWLSNYSTIECLKSANPDVEIHITENEDVVIEL